MVHRISNTIVVVACLSTFLSTSLSAQAQSSGNPDKRPTGTINGQVLAGGSLSVVEGVVVSLSGTELESVTDHEGRFTLAQVPVGSYNAHFRSLGYRPRAHADVIVRPNRITYLEVELEQLAVEIDAVVVVGGYFAEEESQPTSITGFSGEEIRRAPGSAGDVSRILATLPSLAKVNDQSNSLIVRGGSPIENAFYVDNIEIPNINHFPTQGASGGPIGLLNVDLIDDVDFRAGGFGPRYGDRLSSVMDISFREGNRSEFDGQLDLSFAGLGGVAEGPLFSDKGSWLVSMRRSYLDLIFQMADVGSVVVPRYSDFQGKLVYDLSKNHRLTLLGISGDDNISSDSTAAVENTMMVFGDQSMWAGTLGANWRAIWGPGVSNTSLSHTRNKYDEEFTETRSGLPLMRNMSSERTVSLRSVTDVYLNSANSVEFGVEAKHLSANFDNFYAEYTDALGSVTPEMVIDRSLTDTRLSLFASYTARPFDRLTATTGARVDHSTLSGNSHVSPRLSFSYELGRKTSLTGAFGLYYQSLPVTLLAQSQDNRSLSDPRSNHYVLGLNHLITNNTRATVEVYRKEYSDFPIDPQQPSLFVVDELFYRHGFFMNHERLEAVGKARTTGIEATVQKRLAENLYGLASASYFRSKHMGGDNTWRDRVFDNRLVVSLEGGYKPNRAWEFSGRWIFAGGPPYTPFDTDRSVELNRGVLDQNRINGARHPDYHSLNIRVDRRFHFSGSNLIVYLSVWNAYNRKNIASYHWDEIGNVQDASYQWSALPIFGLEYEF